VSILILVVDDEPDIEMLFRQQFRRDLRAGRFSMDFAQSGAAALARIGETTSTLILILSDINMPGMLMSDRIRISVTSLASPISSSAFGADSANCMVKRPSRRSRRNCWRNSASMSGSSSTTRIKRFMHPLRCWRAMPHRAAARS